MLLSEIDLTYFYLLTYLLKTTVFQFIVQKMLPFPIQNKQLEIEMKQTLDAMQNITQDTFKIPEC